jgi:hypothetical protein
MDLLLWQRICGMRSRNEMKLKRESGSQRRRGNHCEFRIHRKMIEMLQIMRSGAANDVTAAGARIFDHHQFGVEIVGEGHDEEKQHQRAGERSPFAPRIMATRARLLRPTNAPDDDTAQSDQQPEYVEKKLHRRLRVCGPRIGRTNATAGPAFHAVFNLLCGGRFRQSLGHSNLTFDKRVCGSCGKRSARKEAITAPTTATLLPGVESRRRKLV